MFKNDKEEQTMGNRAIITTKANFENGAGLGLYLHWNGGRDSVEGFLKYCQIKGFRGFGEDDGYAFARLAQVVGNFFGGGLSVGVNVYDYTEDPWCDNGVYIVKGWEIIDRKYFEGEEQNEYNLLDFIKGLDESMPLDQQLGFDITKCKMVKASDLKVGDNVWVRNWDGMYWFVKVEGLGDGMVNGRDVTGIPYVDLCNFSDPKSNINNYLNNNMYIFAKVCD